MIKTPKLRFKEFSGDWEIKKLNDIADIIDGDRGVNYPKESDFYDSEYCLFLNAKNVTKNGFNFDDKKFITKEKDNALRKGKLNEEDIILTTRGTVGNIAYFNKNIDYKNMRINSGMVILRSKTILPEYLYSYLKSYYFEKQVKQVCFGSAQPQLTVSGINNFRIAKTTKEEQEKIASFFSLIDDKISLQGEKVEALKDYKKGMMQKIFSRELRFKDDDGRDYPSFFSLIDDKISLQGEKVEALKDYKKGMMQKIFSRELRFKDDDGRDYPEWEITTMEKVADLEKGFTPDTKNEKNWIGNIPWLSIADMKQGKYLTDVSKYISDKALGNKQLVAEGTLIMSFKLTLGRLAIVNRPMITNEAICHFYWKYNNINTEYMYYYLSTVNIASFGCRAAKGITLNNDSLNSIVVKLPVINEQMKISNLLKNIDNKIEKEQEKLDSLNEYKKGLLQQMFV